MDALMFATFGPLFLKASSIPISVVATAPFQRRKLLAPLRVFIVI